MTLTAIERLAQQHPDEDVAVLFRDEDLKLAADCIAFVRELYENDTWYWHSDDPVTIQGVALAQRVVERSA